MGCGLRLRSAPPLRRFPSMVDVSWARTGMGGAVDASFKLALVFKFVKFMRYYVKVIAGKKNTVGM
jgi:hypothetical protein